MRLIDEKVLSELHKMKKSNVFSVLIFGVIAVLACAFVLLFKHAMPNLLVMILCYLMSWIYLSYAYHKLMIGNQYLIRVEKFIINLYDKQGINNTCQVVKIDHITIKKLKFIVIDLLCEKELKTLYWLDIHKLDLIVNKTYIFDVFERYILEVNPYV